MLESSGNYGSDAGDECKLDRQDEDRTSERASKWGRRGQPVPKNLIVSRAVSVGPGRVLRSALVT